MAMSTSRDNPGPGSYTPRETDRTNKYRNSSNLVLYPKDRKIELYDKTKLTMPGPQQYTLPSDFGNAHVISTKNLTIPQSTRRKHLRKNAEFERTMIRTVAETTLASPRTMNESLQEAPKSEHKFFKAAAGRTLTLSKSQAMMKKHKVTIKRLNRAYGGKLEQEQPDFEAQQAEIMKHLE